MTYLEWFVAVACCCVPINQFFYDLSLIWSLGSVDCEYGIFLFYSFSNMILRINVDCCWPYTNLAKWKLWLP